MGLPRLNLGQSQVNWDGWSTYLDLSSQSMILYESLYFFLASVT